MERVKVEDIAEFGGVVPGKEMLQILRRIEPIEPSA
jgi:hypothetical protein